MKKQRVVFMFYVMALLLCCSEALVSAATISLPATGQTKCYDTAGTEIACAGTGQDGDKKAGVAWANPRFTVSGECVTDNLTGLMWSKNAYLPGTIKTWQQALDYVASLNAGSGLCGQTDWRLPQILELESLVHEGYNAETCGGSVCGSNADWLKTQGFINVTENAYWSSSTDTVGTAGALSIYIGKGSMSAIGKDYTLLAWLVRGGQSSAPAEVWKTGQTKCYDTKGVEIACAGTWQDGDKQKGVAWPTPRFTDNSNGTITDNLTGLIWLKDANCFSGKTWQDALTAAKTLESGQCGLSDGSKALDWRLPNKKEMRSIFDYSASNPALTAGHPFTNVNSGWYWSSSTVAGAADRAWVVDTGRGLLGENILKSANFNGWPVRGGQFGASQNNCAATVSSSLVVHIPILTFNDANYWADLQYNSAGSNLTILNAGIVSDASPYSGCTASTLASDFKLHIPVLMLGNSSYWLDLQLSGSAFVIAGFGVN